MSLFASILRSLGNSQGIPAPLRPPRPCTSYWGSAAPRTFVTHTLQPAWGLPVPAAAAWVPGLRFSDAALAAFGRQGTAQRPWWRAGHRVAADDAPAAPPPRVASSRSPADDPPQGERLPPLPPRPPRPHRPPSPVAAPVPDPPTRPPGPAAQPSRPGAVTAPSLGEPAEPGPAPTGASDPPEGGTGRWGPWAGSAATGRTPAGRLREPATSRARPAAPLTPDAPGVHPAPAPDRAPAAPWRRPPAATRRHQGMAPRGPTAGSRRADGTAPLRRVWPRLTRRVITVRVAGWRRHRGLLLAVRRDFITLAVNGPRAPRLLFLPIRHILAVIDG